MIFTLTELTPGRWRARNTITEVSHVTYGTHAEVMTQLAKQSAFFEARVKNALGSWKKARPKNHIARTP